MDILPQILEFKYNAEMTIHVKWIGKKDYLLASWVIFYALVVFWPLFFKINVSKKSFRNIIKVSNSLDPDLRPN